MPFDDKCSSVTWLDQELNSAQHDLQRLLDKDEFDRRQAKPPDA